MKRLLIFVMLSMLVLVCSSWGFFAHQRINYQAVFTLPAGINLFYKQNIRYLSDHAVDPDKRRYADSAEAPRHYLDVELYEQHIDSIPIKWGDALKRYGAKKLNSNGILPWQIQRSYYKLVHAFKERDSAKILIYSAYLGHYIADAHVPLHTTANHNGQLTNQHGIHAFWESLLPERFAEKYNFIVGRAVYIEDPLKASWQIVKKSHALLDSVLMLEAQLSARFPAHRKYSFSKRNHQVVRQYASKYARSYHEMMNGMVERQMRAAILMTGSYWYSAWIDAGQPVLSNMVRSIPTAAERQQAETERQRYNERRLIGREP